MRDDGPMSSVIGSLRRTGAAAGAACGACGAATECVVVVSAGLGAACSTGLGRASAVTVCGVGLMKKGAGCEPDCRKTALTIITTVAAVAPRIAKESTGRCAIRARIRDT